MKIFNILAGLLMSSVTASAGAAEVAYSYADLNDQLIAFESPKADNYDVAVKMTNLGFENASVKGVRVLFPESSDISGYQAWLSTELKLESNKNVADLVTVDAVVADGYLTATFPDGFVIPDEGIYVGYSFSVEKYNDSTKGPVILGKGDSSDGFFLHTSKKYYSWANMYEKTGLVSAMEIILAGDFPENNGMISLTSDLNFGINQEEFEIPLAFTNLGYVPIEEMEFAYSFNGNEEFTAITTFDPAREIQFTGSIPLSVFVENHAEKGSNEFVLRLSKINGQEVPNIGGEITTELYAFADMPTRRVLVEEYTGLWCGYCPRGYAAMEYMAKNYPYDYIGVSYHSRDVMETVPYTDYPSSVMAFPVSTIDRQEQGDPFFWTGFSGFGFLEAWEKQLNKFTPVTIDMSAVSYDTDSRIVTLDTEVSFIKQPDNDCRIFYLLTANGLSDPTWLQTNYLSGESFESYGIDEIVEFIEGGDVIQGMVFNDIPVVWSDLRGIEESLPAANSIITDQTYTHSIEFDLNGVVSVQGYDLIGNATSIRAIAGVADSITGEVLNCTVALIEGLSGVGSIDGKDDQPVEYYTLSGIKIERPTTSGLYIRRTGEKTEKVFFK